MSLILSLSVIILISDQITKFIAVSFLKSKGSLVLFPFFHLSYVENTGIAFGLFQGYPQILGFIIASSVILLLLGSWFLRNNSLKERIAYAFILGGAIGNLIDRIRFQYVIDFLDFRVWPVFNLADSFITIGVALFLFFAIKGR